jgi:hypothetical protein
MRWLYLTVGLLSASFCLVAWIYLRDRDPSSWRPPEQQLASVDATAALTALGGGDCGSGCAAELLGRIQPHRWLVRVTVKGRSRCLQISLEEFATSEQHGLSGVQPRRCAPHRNRDP